jgi:hypothetical protein
MWNMAALVALNPRLTVLTRPNCIALANEDTAFVRKNALGVE